MFECQFCLKTYKNNASLLMHTNNRPPKFCRKIREKLTCPTCKTIVPTREGLERHIKLCNPDLYYMNFLKQKEEMELDFKTQITKLELVVAQKEKTLEIKTKEWKQKLEEEKTRYQEMFTKYSELAKICASKDTTTVHTTTTNNFMEKVNILNLSNEHIQGQVDENFTLEHFIRGADGVASFTDKYIIRNGNELLYIPSDQARLTFKFNTDNGTKRDSQAMELIHTIHPPIMNKIKDEMFSHKDYVNGELEISPETADVYYDSLSEISGIPGNPKKFCKKLVGVSN